MNRVRAMADTNGIDYKCIIGRPEYLKAYKPSWFSDSLIVRFHELSKDRQALWLDSDCEVNGELFTMKYKSGKPYVLKSKCQSAAMFCNNCPEVFERLIAIYDPNKGCICKQYFNTHMKEFFTFPDKLIRHRCFGGRA
jgi:hypothetical protein